ncbi:MAG: calcium-binding protein, partial [Roseococcus sp.]|nr:calcium-binding protein [Roseococcus sp.]
GLGNDVFRFDALTDAGDSITDFTKGSDAVWLSASAFGGLAPGAVAAENFALDAADAGGPQFVYRAATGVLSWDADGTGVGGAVTIATLTTRPALEASDLFLF